jgi:hypothetical protein
MPYGMKFYQKGKGQKQKGGSGVWFRDTKKSWGF